MVREVSRFPSGGPGVVGWSFHSPGCGVEALQEVREWSGGPSTVTGVVGGPPGGPEMVECPSWSSRSGFETLPKVRNCLGEPPEGPEVVGRPSRRSGSGW